MGEDKNVYQITVYQILENKTTHYILIKPKAIFSKESFRYFNCKHPNCLSTVEWKNK